MEEPQLAVFIRGGHAPGVPKQILGNWKSVEEWPPKDQKQMTLFLQKGKILNTLPGSLDSETLVYKASAGIEASGSVMWWGDWSPDITKSETNSLIYQTEPLNEDITILGFPSLDFNGAVSQPQAHFITRLSDVSPQNEVTLITGAGLNGSHRNSSSNPEFLKPHKIYSLSIDLHFTSWTFKKGHRIRVSISNGQWPMIWPNPSGLDFTLQLGGEQASALILPVIDSINKDEIIFLKPNKDPKLKGYQTIQSGTVSGFAEISESTYNPETGIAQVIASNSGGTIYPWATWTSKERIVHQVNNFMPEYAKVTSDYQIEIKTKKKTLIWYGIFDFKSDSQHFYYKYTRELMDGSKLIRRKVWNDTILRDFQ